MQMQAGPIVIGSFNIIEASKGKQKICVKKEAKEQVEIVNSSEVPLVIGDHNMLEVGVKVLGEGGQRMGDGNLLEPGSLDKKL
ncbi:unnamed protein product [Durusdinium trenchii]|uniref:Uncharacterized protein n=1 Tax=Durusdinium trenchii TaxID=1381693 RepID=A0ABP0HED8_9DINO